MQNASPGMGKEFWGDFSRKLRRMVLIHKRRIIIIIQMKIKTKITITQIKIIIMVASDSSLGSHCLNVSLVLHLHFSIVATIIAIFTILIIIV